MATIDPSLISDPQEQKWVDEMSKRVNHLLEMEVKSPLVSLFRVPETITKNKPDAYEPQQIGLGPIHHFQPRPYKKMQQKKLVILRNMLQDNKIKDYKLTVLNSVKNLVPIVRSCYDMFLQDDDEHLTWIFAIDGLFLLNLLRTYDRLELQKVSPKKRLVAQDVMMVENQIPFMILKQIDDALLSSSSTSNSSDSANNVSRSIYQNFCTIHSPLKLCLESQAPSSVDHLLDYMYHSIVNNVSAQKPLQTIIPVPEVQSMPVFQAGNLVTNLPKKEIVEAYEQTISILEAFCECKLVIPSASNLYNAGFRFYALEEDQGIKNIYVRDEKDVYLPILTLNKDSDVILRNLVAYETLTLDQSDSFPLTEFMVLMCALVVTIKDVKRLGNVIKGDLEADKVAKLFTGMSSCIPSIKMTRKSNLQQTIDEINMVYESRFSMELYLLLKKLAHWLLVVLRAIGGFVGSSWKILAFMVSILTAVWLTLQAYCEVYGCDNDYNDASSLKVL